MRRDRCRLYRLLKKTEMQLQQANRRAEMFRKRFQRLKGTDNKFDSPSPNTKVRHIIRRRTIPAAYVRKRYNILGGFAEAAKTKCEIGQRRQREADDGKVC